MSETLKIPTDFYITFCAAVDQTTTARLLNLIAVAIQNKCTHIHLLFQSTGGTVVDGICLYNFFKSLPCELTIYNVGSVQSIATIAYLGAKNRIASKHSTFMLHKTTSGYQFPSAIKIPAVERSLEIDDTRTDEILRKEINLSPDNWATLKITELYFTGEEAVKTGISKSIGEFSPPFGVQIYNATC